MTCGKCGDPTYGYVPVCNACATKGENEMTKDFSKEKLLDAATPAMPDEIWVKEQDGRTFVYFQEEMAINGSQKYLKHDVLSLINRADIANERLRVAEKEANSVIRDLAEALESTCDINGMEALQKHAERIKQARGE